VRLLCIGLSRSSSFLEDETDTNGATLHIEVLGLLLEISLGASWIKR